MTLRLIAWCILWVDSDSVLIHVNELLLNNYFTRYILSTHRIYLHKTAKYVKIKLRMRGNKTILDLMNMRTFLKCFLLIIFIWSGNTTMASDKTINSLAMLFNLNGKTAIITGASQGLGKQFAIILNKAGARVILASRDIDKLNTFSKELKNSKAIQMDVANSASVKAAFAALEEAGEKIDICINNAATGALTPVFSEDDNGDFERVMQTNVMGVWYVTKAVANHMKSHKINGSIINISSVKVIASLTKS
ncbi:Gluconate 5-dehydrogenase [Holospora curviuscula]|uniref:Gluconate 5-dehydrogenase n=1 Tax=Holospora curviuscula TaxID=1082868 RepID=A0A2S5R7V3_9PROT|nr:Gluconate 5-dehydrogenase [Holospora curviuscula]